MNALKEESETLQDVTDQFTPLMERLQLFFFWESEKTDLKYTKDYVVDMESAAPLIYGSGRCGIAKDHKEMCRFDSNAEQGFISAISVLKRFCSEAPQAIGELWDQEMETLSQQRRHEASRILKSIGRFTKENN